MTLSERIVMLSGVSNRVFTWGKLKKIQGQSYDISDEELDMNLSAKYIWETSIFDKRYAIVQLQPAEQIYRKGFKPLYRVLKVSLGKLYVHKFKTREEVLDYLKSEYRADRAAMERKNAN